jgi:hypothetical protein
MMLLACQDQPDIPPPAASIVSTDKTDSNKHISNDTLQSVLKDTPQLKDYFADSLHIGKKGYNKIQIAQYNKGDSIFVTISFFSKLQDEWQLKNEYQFEKNSEIGCQTQISDFNNDGFNDITYISNAAARGANEVRRLLIYDKKNDQLIALKNGEQPNMEYNKKLKCIDAFAVHGGCSTIFFKISGDSLVEFASVDLSPEGLTITEYDKNGKGKVIRNDTTITLITEGFMRYSNYKPLQE